MSPNRPHRPIFFQVLNVLLKYPKEKFTKDELARVVEFETGYPLKEKDIPSTIRRIRDFFGWRGIVRSQGRGFHENTYQQGVFKSGKEKE